MVIIVVITEGLDGVDVVAEEGTRAEAGMPVVVVEVQIYDGAPRGGARRREG